MWFDESIVMTDEMESYLLGRGAKRETLEAMNLGEWQPTPEAIQRHPESKYLYGWLACPLRTPAGKIAGCDFRNIHHKDVRKIFFGTAAEWTSLWVAPPNSFLKIWQHQPVYLVEGIFDMFALEWAVPSTAVVMACGRAGMTNQQMEALRRMQPSRVHMVFDMDVPGRKASQFVSSRLRKIGLDVIEHSYSCKDPGEVWLKYGASGLVHLLG